MQTQTTEKTPVKKASKATISSTARKMILAGRTNEQVWRQLKLLYKLDDSKKHYPAWYRADLRRKGLLTETVH